MAIKRFNWDNWDIVVNDGVTVEGDIYRADYKFECASEIPGISSSPSGGPIPPITPELSGCQLYIPPLITEFNIFPSSIVEFNIINDRIG